MGRRHAHAAFQDDPHSGSPRLNLFVLSPHRDDAAFSLSLSITRWLAAGHRVTILNVFTRSLYAPYADIEEPSESARLDLVSSLRKREDQAFLETFGDGVAMLDLDLHDAPIRLHRAASVVCDLDVLSHDPAIPIICKALDDLAHAGRNAGKAALVLPLGLGHHVDHRTARDAALPLTLSLPSAFYEDLPYATRDGVRIDLTRFREDTQTRLHEPLFPVLCHGTPARPIAFKRRIALGYKSQIDSALADVIAAFSRRYQGAERLWANQAWLDLATREHLSTPQRDPEAEPLPA